MVMMRANVHEIKAHLSKYLRRLASGKDDVVVVCVRNVPVAELRATRASRQTPRPIGLERERFRVPASFFDPLPEATLDAFEGKPR
jgi:antitoxin (DNA-binding transcriptional repressor) of toxin-antitoxin stability system